MSRDGSAPLAMAASGALGVLAGVVAWWIVLYGAAFAISIVTQDVVWGRAVIRTAQAAAVLIGIVGAVRLRSRRAFMVGALVGFVGFELWVLAT